MRPLRFLQKVSLGLFLAAGLSACAQLPPQAPDAPATELPTRTEFAGIVARLAPVVQNTCIETEIASNCKIRLFVAQTPDKDANAFQSVDRLGRPFVVVTPELLDMARSPDEIALVLAHEAAHHILGHLDRQSEDAQFGAALLAAAAERDGASRQQVREARKIGAFVGARSFSQDYELEADALGAVMVQQAGYDAMKGAAFFYRIPDPGNHALNTHPSNAQRRNVVRNALRGVMPGA